MTTINDLYVVIKVGSMPIVANPDKKNPAHWVQWEIRKYPNRNQLILATPILSNQTKYATVGLTWDMIRIYLIEMKKLYGDKQMADEMGVGFIIYDQIKWNNHLKNDKAAKTILDFDI